jgi:hypothetical protein
MRHSPPCGSYPVNISGAAGVHAFVVGNDDAAVVGWTADLGLPETGDLRLGHELINAQPVRSDTRGQITGLKLVVTHRDPTTLHDSIEDRSTWLC